MSRTLATIGIALILLSVGPTAQRPRPQDVELQAAIRVETVDGDLPAAIARYQAIAEKYASDRPLVAQALLRMADAYQRLGDPQARAVYDQLIRNFSDQREIVETARARLAVREAPADSAHLSLRRVHAGPSSSASRRTRAGRSSTSSIPPGMG